MRRENALLAADFLSRVASIPFHQLRDIREKIRTQVREEGKEEGKEEQANFASQIR